MEIAEIILLIVLFFTVRIIQIKQSRKQFKAAVEAYRNNDFQLMKTYLAQYNVKTQYRILAGIDKMVQTEK